MLSIFNRKNTRLPPTSNPLHISSIYARSTVQFTARRFGHLFRLFLRQLRVFLLARLLSTRNAAQTSSTERHISVFSGRVAVHFMAVGRGRPIEWATRISHHPVPRLPHRPPHITNSIYALFISECLFLEFAPCVLTLTKLTELQAKQAENFRPRRTAERRNYAGCTLLKTRTLIAWEFGEPSRARVCFIFRSCFPGRLLLAKF